MIRALLGAVALLIMPFFSLRAQVVLPNLNTSNQTEQGGIAIPSLQASAPAQLSQHLLVVCNANDPESLDLAQDYAQARHIAADHILPLSCSSQEEITRAEYETTLREPIVSYLSRNNWLERIMVNITLSTGPEKILLATRNDIWAMVLIRGVPLKIAEDKQSGNSLEREPQLQINAAAVDSELATLPTYGLPLGGYIPNPFYNAPDYIRAGPELARKVILVCRLDGPTVDDVKRMIQDSVAVEKNRLTGWVVIDARGLTDVKNGYTIGDLWLREAKKQLTSDGWPIDFDDREALIPDSDPCNHVALYLGWYSGNPQGPLVTLPSRFVPGAIAYHLHSFSASTVRSATSNWVGPLIDHGADATMGTVYEPFLDLTPHLDIFTERLLAGNTFGEAAYAAQKGLSWMGTVVGDPLYQPFQQTLEVALDEAQKNQSSNLPWLLLQKTRRDVLNGTIPAQTEALQKSLMVDGAGAPTYEGLGDLLEKVTDTQAPAAAMAAYQKALELNSDPIDQIRIGLKLAQHQVNHGQGDLAQAELKGLLERYPVEAQRFGVPSQLAPTGSPEP